MTAFAPIFAGGFALGLTRPSMAHEGDVTYPELMPRLGHRGTLAQENTIAGFRAALSAGLDGVELDVQLSRDGHIVVFHDEDTLRSWGPPSLRIATSDLESLRARATAVDLELPTLSEVLDMWPRDKLLNVEIKSAGAPGRPSLVLADAVRDCLSRAPRPNTAVIVSSFDPRVLEPSRWARAREMSEVETALLIDEESLPRLFDAAGRDLDVDGVHLHARDCTRPRIEHLNHRGLRIGCWGAASYEDELRLASWGVERIITDHLQIGPGTCMV